MAAKTKSFIPRPVETHGETRQDTQMLANTDPPVCPTCTYSKAMGIHWGHKQKYKTVKGPVECVSVCFESSTAGFTAQMKCIMTTNIGLP